MKLRRWDPERQGAFDEKILVERLERAGYRVTRYEYPPGTVFGAHTHAADKIDAVVEGRFQIGMGGESVVLERGDWIEVPAGTEHTAEVVGDQTVVSLDAVRVR